MIENKYLSVDLEGNINLYDFPADNQFLLRTIRVETEVDRLYDINGCIDGRNPCLVLSSNFKEIWKDLDSDKELPLTKRSLVRKKDGGITIGYNNRVDVMGYEILANIRQYREFESSSIIHFFRIILSNRLLLWAQPI